MAGPRVVCCGLTTLDVTQVLDALPGPDEKVVARSAAVEVGGPAANAARTAAALGRPTLLVTALGTGPLAELVRDRLGAEGIDVVDLADDGEPPLSTVLVTAATGQRAVASTNAVGRSVRLPATALLDGAGALLVDGHLLAAQTTLAAAARSRGVPVLLDGGSFKVGLEGLLAHVDLAVLSADFALPDGAEPTFAPDLAEPDLAEPGPDDHEGRLLAAVAELGPSFVARSHGAGPVAVLAGGVRTELAVPAVGDVVDTLGAGDVLHGATAAALAEGSSWVDALAAGIATASRSVRFPGAMGWAVTGG
ncbi:PfkB family carbohydrate kinase [Georgenia subflava]|uniref:Carbohydrate kinase n=1 Tax=Georgenia subflava TaxID=1622177 RepID=A0A6N7ENJ7_9MICO|nr:PfkB family carbohydrate kinase [Georgenia subflava]MPV37716.1 carbohydrate kinase [Georgenia subflava]